MTREQRLHRETDPRVGRSLGLTAVCAVCLVVAALFVVAVRVQHVRLSYQLDVLRTERTRVENLIQQLEVQVATLRAPRRALPGAGKIIVGIGVVDRNRVAVRQHAVGQQSVQVE